MRQDNDFMRNKTQNRRKILMLIPELGYGGAEKSFLRLSKLLSENHDVQDSSI